MKPLDTELARIRMGERIAQLRKEKGLSLRQLSAICGIHFINLHKIEHGKMNPTVNKLAAIADALDSHMDLIRGKVK